MTEFGRKLRLHRRNARDNENGGLLSQARLADLLSLACGVVYSRAAVSDWERGKGQIHKDDRAVLVGLIDVLHQSGGIRTLEEANDWLAAGNYRRLDEREARRVSAEWLTPKDYSYLRVLVPSLPAHNIIGRDELLSRLKDQLFAGRNVALSAINGLPGVGKTTLAALLAHDADVAAEFPDGVLWVGLGRDPDQFHLLGQWGQAVGVSAEDLAKMGAIRQRANAVHDAIADRRMLLVLDDVWDAATIAPFKLGGSRCTHILTTRQPPLAAAFAGENALRVAELDEPFAVELLHQLAPRIFAQRPDAALEIVRRTGGLPLALVLVGNHLRQKGSSSRRIEAALARVMSAGTLQALSEPQPIIEKDAHPSLPENVPISLASIVDASVDALSADARAALGQLALFPPKPNSFSEEAALAVADTTTDALDELVDHGLLEPREGERYSLHQTIHQHAQQEQAVGAPERFADWHLSFVLEADESQIDRERSNVEAALTCAAEEEHYALFLRLVAALAPYLESRGLVEMAERRFAQAIRLDLADEPTATARVYQYRGRLLHRKGEFDEAERMWQQSLSLGREVDATEICLDVLSELTTIASERGDQDAVSAYYEEGIELARAHGLTLQAVRLMGNQARHAWVHEQYATASKLLDEAIPLAESAELAEPLCALLNFRGAVAWDQQQRGAAKADYLTALAIARELRNRERISILLINLGEVALGDGDLAAAEMFNDEALDLAEALGNRVRQSYILKTLAQVSAERDDFDLSRERFSQSLDIARTLNTPIRALDTMLAWGEMELSMGDNARARQLFADCLALEGVEGITNGNVGLAHYGAAQAIWRSGEHTKALQHSERAIELLNTVNHVRLDDALRWRQNKLATSHKKESKNE